MVTRQAKPRSSPKGGRGFLLDRMRASPAGLSSRENLASLRTPDGKTIAAVVAWLAIVAFVTPEIESFALHRGGGWDYLLLVWLFVFSPSAGVAVATFVVLRAALRDPGFQAVHIAPVPATTLARIRILVSGILLTSTLWEHLPSTAAIPRELIRPMGVLKLLYALPIGFERMAASATALGIFQAVTAGLLLLSLLGWRTRATVPLAALAYTILGGLLRQYVWFYHTGLIPLYVLWVLSVTPCGDGFSLDRRRRTRDGRETSDEPRSVYAWSRYACWVAVALPYFAAGASKLRNSGLGWMGEFAGEAH